LCGAGFEPVEATGFEEPFMTESSQHLDPIEQLIAEADQAERAGVFRASRIDAVSLVQSPGSGEVPFFVSWRRFGVPLAACVTLAVGVGALLLSRELSGIAKQQLLAANSSAAQTSPEGFLHCLDGPEAGAVGDCSSYDFDNDGDVDLLDFSSFQSTYALASTR